MRDVNDQPVTIGLQPVPVTLIGQLKENALVLSAYARW
jgi:hypothetical protein